MAGRGVTRAPNRADVSAMRPHAAAGIIGFLGNEVAAQVRLRAGRRLGDSRLVTDGNHAHIDAFVGLGGVLSAGRVSLGAECRRADH